MSGSLIGGGDPSTNGLEPGMCPRVCALGPRTSPRNRSSDPSSRSSQATSTIWGRSDTGKEVPQDPVELAGQLYVDEMACARDLADIELPQLVRGDERVRLADDELQRPVELARDRRRVPAVPDRLDRTDQAVRIPEQETLVCRALVRVELRRHRAPQPFGPFVPDQLDRVRAARAPLL